jgi:AraC family transcriptional regulator
MIYCPPDEEHAQAFASDGAFQAQITPTADCLTYLQDTMSLSTASFSAGHHFSSLGRKMSIELQRQDALSPLALEGLALEALTLFGRASFGHVRRPRWLPAVEDYVREHALDGFTVQDVANAAGCSPEQIGPAVRTAFGVSLAGLARRRRLEQAAEILAADGASISAVAALCGFSDQAHLTRAFKSVYGITPGAFRRAKTLPRQGSIRR